MKLQFVQTWKGTYMARTLALALPAILAFGGFAQAQYDYYYPSEAPSDPRWLVAGWYEHYLGRGVDPGALYWIHDLQMGYTPEQVLSTILSSQEYLERAGGTQSGLIRRLYLDIGGRAPTEKELKYWQGRMRFDSVQEIAYQLLSLTPQDWSAKHGAAPHRPGYYPEPTIRSKSDPAAPYRKSSSQNYEYRRPAGRTIIVTPR
jgi:hypothetical protein